MADEPAEYVPETPDPGQVEGDAPLWFKVVFVVIALLPMVLFVLIARGA